MLGVSTRRVDELVQALGLLPMEYLYFYYYSTGIAPFITFWTLAAPGSAGYRAQRSAVADAPRANPGR